MRHVMAQSIDRLMHQWKKGRGCPRLAYVSTRPMSLNSMEKQLDAYVQSKLVLDDYFRYSCTHTELWHQLRYQNIFERMHTA